MRRIVALSLGLTLAVSAQAELLITDFLVETKVLGKSTDPDGELRPYIPIVPYIVETGYSRRAMDRSDDQRLGLPWALTSQLDLHVCNDGRFPCDQPAGNISATQTKTGWFKSQAVLHHGFFPDFRPEENLSVSGAFANAETLYYSKVETTTPDTPLVLHFVFEGARASALAHYGGNGIDMDFGARISAMKNAPAGYIPDQQAVVWETGATVADSATGFEFTARDFDAQGIGSPSMTTEQGWVPSSFQYHGEVSRGRFVGTLDFGLLQPGESFSFSYASYVYLSSDRSYAAELFAQVVDPFELESPLPALELEGLPLLPRPSAVPLPGTSVMTLSALGALLAGSARRRANTRV